MNDFKCPSCSVKLTEAVTKYGRELWCSNPKCESLEADVGGVGRTSQEAFDLLSKSVEDEREADLNDIKKAGC